MADVRRVFPSEVAPPGMLDKDPDAAAGFAPADAENPAGEAPLSGPGDDPAVDMAAEPEPPPPRPEVTYHGSAGSRVYTLLCPVTIDGRKLTGITIHPPALWDVQDWAAGRLPTNYDLTARMVNMDPVALGALRWPDIQAILDIAMPMLPDAVREAITLSQQAGATQEG